MFDLLSNIFFYRVYTYYIVLGIFNIPIKLVTALVAVDLLSETNIIVISYIRYLITIKL